MKAGKKASVSVQEILDHTHAHVILGTKQSIIKAEWHLYVSINAFNCTFFKYQEHNS